MQSHCDLLSLGLVQSSKEAGGTEENHLRPDSAVVCAQPGQRERETEWAVRQRKKTRQSWEKAKRKGKKDSSRRRMRKKRSWSERGGEESVSHCLTVGC